MDYINKLNSHKKFNNYDIKLFCIDQTNNLELNDYIKSLEFDHLNYGTSIYCKKIKSIIFDTNFENYYKYRLKYNGFYNKIFCNYNDLFNLFVINIIYHELWHAKQEQIISNETNSNYSTLINFSDKLCDKRELYIKYHDRLFIEYDAIINSIILTFDYINNLNFNDKSLNILNTHFSGQILSSYGYYSKDTKKYNSPISFLQFFLDNDIFNKKELEKIKISIDEYQHLVKNNINDLVNGISINKNLIEYIKNIRNGNFKSNNIIEDIKTYYKSIN